MSAPIRLATAQADDARRAAYDDRAGHAELLLRLAVREAIDLIRAGQPGYATYRLTRAGCAAERILGPTSVAGVNVTTPAPMLAGAGSKDADKGLDIYKPGVPAPATAPSGGVA